MEWYLRPGEPVAPLRHEICRYFDAHVDDDTLGAIAVIVGELLANVAKHTDSGAEVILDWDHDTPMLTVIDAGPGYSLDDLPRRSGRDTDVPERGFGLVLVKELARDLRVTRGPRGGTTVTVELPVD